MQIYEDGRDAWFVREIAAFVGAKEPDVRQYLAMEDATLVCQSQVWTRHRDKVLSDLAKRFLCRRGLAAIDDPVSEKRVTDARDCWEEELRRVVEKQGFCLPEYYALRDDLKLTIYDPYKPEKEEQDPYNAIFIQPSGGGSLSEISGLLKRLGPLTGVREKQYLYYVPKECRDAAMALATSRKW